MKKTSLAAGAVLAVAVVALIAFIIIKNNTNNTDHMSNTPSSDNQRYTGIAAPIADTLAAMGLSLTEMKIYGYLFTAGPITVDNAFSGVRLPEVSKADFEAGIPRLVQEGLVIQKDQKYSVSGIAFLIQKTKESPKLNYLTAGLEQWERMTIQ